MHMADALVSATVGLTLWGVAGVALARCARTLRRDESEPLVALMGVLAAFVFAAQMVNFSIPGTGSSGHLGGGLLLAALLGPHAALVAMASVLTVQALFFADGGLLALGANIFNLGVLPCFVGYGLVFRPLLARCGSAPTPRCLGVASLLAAVASAQLGALAVVLETRFSGISSLPTEAFLWLMQPIHLAIGVVEGVATAALLQFVRTARPDLLAPSLPLASARPPRRGAAALIGIAGVALLTALLSRLASAQPDGLEWSIARLTGATELASPQTPVHARLAALQQRLAVFAQPDAQRSGRAGHAP